MAGDTLPLVTATPGFLTLAGPGEAETRVRASRFVALAFPAETEAAARAGLEARAKEHFDATHHCAAWRLRDGLWRAIDAGEPSGSAGAPILAAIDAEELVDVAVIVTRWFGGTKLGVGGLVRAYGEAAAEALATAPRRRGVHAVRASIRYAFEDTSPVMRSLERSGASQMEYEFADAGRATVTFVIPAGEVDSLKEFLAAQTSGRAGAEIIGGIVLYQ